jgi:hypothetical protein
MRIAARLALHAPSHISGALDEYVRGPASKHLLGYQGCDVLVSDISESGFTASINAEIQAGAVVSLRLPGAGVMVARVNDCADGSISAAFVNPVPATRLRKTVGMGRFAAFA